MDRHGAEDFEKALCSALEEIGYVEISRRINYALELFDVWTRASIRLPAIKDLVKEGTYENLLAAPPTTKGWRRKHVPAQFGTALIVRDQNATGILSTFHQITVTFLDGLTRFRQDIRRYKYE